VSKVNRVLIHLKILVNALLSMAILINLMPISLTSSNLIKSGTLVSTSDHILKAEMILNSWKTKASLEFSTPKLISIWTTGVSIIQKHLSNTKLEIWNTNISQSNLSARMIKNEDSLKALRD